MNEKKGWNPRTYPGFLPDERSRFIDERLAELHAMGHTEWTRADLVTDHMESIVCQTDLVENTSTGTVELVDNGRRGNNYPPDKQPEWKGPR